jgi:hypothetical protein
MLSVISHLLSYNFRKNNFQPVCQHLRYNFVNYIAQADQSELTQIPETLALKAAAQTTACGCGNSLPAAPAHSHPLGERGDAWGEET